VERVIFLRVVNKSRWEVYSGDGGEEGGQIGEGKCTYVRSCARHCPKGAWGMASAAYDGRIKGDSPEESKEPVDIFNALFRFQQCVSSVRLRWS
jgi:ferredoxin